MGEQSRRGMKTGGRETGGQETGGQETGGRETGGPVVAMRGIVKRFGAVTAVAGAHFDLHPGEIHALLGENGAGKTTLMNLLYGLERPDAGVIEIDGEPVRLRSAQDAIGLGIGMVHQHFQLVPRLTVTENVILGTGSQRRNKNAILAADSQRLDKTATPASRSEGRSGAAPAADGKRRNETTPSADDGRRVRLPDLGAAATEIEELGGRYGLPVSGAALVADLSVGEQQRVEILRALYRGARVLILDEPTATLSPAEIDQLIGKLRGMTDDGAAIVMITHHLDEVMAAADRITVLRAGANVATVPASETSPLELARMMVGREVAMLSEVAEADEIDEARGSRDGRGDETSRDSKADRSEKAGPAAAKQTAADEARGSGGAGQAPSAAVAAETARTAGAVVLAVKGLASNAAHQGASRFGSSRGEIGQPLASNATHQDINSRFGSGRGEIGQPLASNAAHQGGASRAFSDVDLEVRASEIVTIAGVEGNGQAELEEALCGLRRPASGRIKLNGTDVTGAAPRRLLDSGVGFIPSDRYRRGLVRGLSVAENLVCDRIDRPPYGRRFRIHPAAIAARGAELVDQFQIAARSPAADAATLSGGNAQKVVLARALRADLRLLIAAQPTRGLDVGAIEMVWDHLRAQRDAGVAILLITTDLTEVMALSDRCCVIYRGRLTETPLNREAIGMAMGGAGPTAAGKTSPP